MLKRFAVAAAVGTTMFGLAGAGASMLNTSGSATAVQQTNALSATCQSTAVNFSNVVTDQDATAAHVFQQSVEPGCSNEFLQVALKIDNGSIAYSNKVWIPTSNVTSAGQEAFLLNGSTALSTYGTAVYGEDLLSQFPAGVCAANVASTVVTVAGQIDSPGSNTAGAVVGTLPTCTNDSFSTPSA
jgi:hypothetical protein